MPIEKGPSNQDKLPQTQEVSQPVPEEKEQKFDSEYLHSITRYFDDRREEFKDDPIMLDYLTQCRDILTKLRDPKVAEKVQPKEVCFALAQALQEIPTVLFPGPGELENLEYFEKNYLESRKVFMDTCKKVFPEIESEIDPSTINRTMRKIHGVNGSTLGSNKDAEHITRITMAVSEVQKDLKEDPQKLMKEIDNLMHEYHNTIGSTYMGKLKDHYETGEGEFELPEDQKINSAVIVENLYKLQLVKDELMKRIYERADVTPIEKRAIDKAKSEVK